MPTLSALALPTDNPERVAQLRLKLEEYRSRHEAYQAPELQIKTIMKTVVLDRLLQEGRVQRTPLAGELAERFGSAFSQAAFANAWAVIGDYCATGGTQNRGGTGLPPVVKEVMP